MRAILIDPFTRTVQTVEHSGDYHEIYKLIDAGTFEVLPLDDRGNGLYLDEDGLFADRQEFFALGNYPQPLAGKGLILGVDSEGESAGTTLKLEAVFAAVRWLSPEEAVAMNANAVRAMHAAAEGRDDVIVAAPTLEIDPDTGKARAL